MALTENQIKALDYAMGQVKSSSLDINPINVVEYILNNLALFSDQNALNAAIQAKQEQDRQNEIDALRSRLDQLTGG